jgi:hypothetical protein
LHREATIRLERNNGALLTLPRQGQEVVMHDIIYLVGLVVIVLFILSALGLR